MNSAIMTGFLDYYSLLRVSKDASQEEVRKNFRKLAHSYHPDKNENTFESQIIFRSLLQAYKTLTSPEEKARYDIYLRTSPVLNRKGKAAETRRNTPPDANETIDNMISQLNYILWEVEDILSKTDRSLLQRHISGFTIEKWLSHILTFIDQWILTPSGYGDYFFTARNIDMDKPYNPYSSGISGDHLPYIDCFDYFYQIRRRMDKFLTKFNKTDLSGSVAGSQITLIDCVYEAVALSFHYLGSIRQVLNGEAEKIRRYSFIHQAFSQSGSNLLSS